MKKIFNIFKGRAVPFFSATILAAILSILFVDNLNTKRERCLNYQYFQNLPL